MKGVGEAVWRGVPLLRQPRFHLEGFVVDAHEMTLRDDSQDERELVLAEEAVEGSRGRAS